MTQEEAALLKKGDIVFCIYWSMADPGNMAIGVVVKPYDNDAGHYVRVANGDRECVFFNRNIFGTSRAAIEAIIVMGQLKIIELKKEIQGIKRGHNRLRADWLYDPCYK